MVADRRETDKLLAKLNLLASLNEEAHKIAQELVEEAISQMHAHYPEADHDDE